MRSLGRTTSAAGRSASAVGSAAVWVAVDDGAAARIDPDTHDVVSTNVGGAPRGVGIGGGAVWLSVD